MIDEIYEYAKKLSDVDEDDNPNYAMRAVNAVMLYKAYLLSARGMILALAEFLDDVLEESEEVDKMRAWVNRKYFELV